MPTDEDALSWGGEADPSHVDGPKAPKPTEAPKQEAPKQPTPTVVEVPAEEKPATSSFLLVSYGILAGAYLIYMLGWIVAVTRSTTTLPSLLGEIMFQFGEFLAIGSGVLWFAAVFLLTRERRSIVRLLWLLLGLVILVPWPFVLGGS